MTVTGIPLRALHHRLGARLAIALEKILLEGSGIHADAHRAAMIFGSLHHFFDALARADIAGIDA